MSTDLVIKKFEHYSRLVALFAISAGIIPQLQAQSTISGYVTGVVSDPSKALVGDATVTLQNPATSFSQTTRTSSEGAYHFDFVPPGAYNLSVSHSGFGVSRESVTVTVGQSTTANAELAVGSSTSTVDVISEASPLQTENADISTNYNQER